jgi:hypothetical protein
MELELFESQIKSLEIQLKVLKAKTKRHAYSYKTFASLCGVLKRITKSTYEDIKSVEYQIKWDGKK